MRCRCWAGALALLLLAAGLPAQAQQKVSRIEIKHVGPPAASDELIRSMIRVKVGDPFNRLAVDNDVHTLNESGLFYNVRMNDEPGADGVHLIYVLQGNPRITEIKFQGNQQYSTAKLRKKLTSKVGEPLKEKKLFDDAKTLREFYQKAGYQKTTVDYTPEIVEATGRATVVFKIAEAPKLKIKDVVFDGAKAFPQSKLRKAVKTRRTWMFGWLTGAGKLKDEQLEEDKDRLKDFYHNEGYIDFELKDVTTEPLTPKKVILHFRVAEGRCYRVGQVVVKGNALFTTNQVLGVVKMKSGSIFTPKGLTKDVEAVRDLYGAKGFIEARVLPRPNPNVEGGTMDLSYELVEGDKSYIEKIEIKGNVKTKDKVIRRELAVAPGEVFDMVKVKRSKTRLEQVNYFERVDARPEDTDVPNRKNLVIGVDEKNTGNFSVGAGFSTVESLVGFVDLTQGNFDLFKPPTFQGAGQKFRLHVAVGLLTQDYVLSFVEPWFLNRKLALGVELYHRDWAFLSDYYNERRTGMKLSLSRALGSDFLIGTVSGTLEDIGIYNVSSHAPATIIDSDGSYLVGRAGASLAYDTRNSAMMPNKGQRTELFGEVAGGDFNLYKVEVRTAWYFPGFFQGHIWEIIGRVGTLESLGKGIATPDSSLPENEVPFFERYFLGGAYNLRGFKYRDVGPREALTGEPGTEPIGGNSYYMASVEYSIPIIERLRVAVFYDMGNVFYDSWQFDFGKFSADVGVGLRLNLPIGPIRLDYGFPIRRVNNEDGSGRFNFTVGWTRDF